MNINRMFDSPGAFARYVAELPGARTYAQECNADWAGGTTDLGKLTELAQHGWAEGEQRSMPIASEAVESIERELPASQPMPYLDVTGASVDVGSYLEGVPECMIDFRPTTVSKVGRVVTLCASVVYSMGLSAEQVIQRGAYITALALALEQTGHSVELYADMSGPHYTGDNYKTRILVKGATERVDPSVIAYAYAHPSVCRVLMHGDQAEHWNGSAGIRPEDPDQDLPDGTIYLPSLNTEYNNADDGPRMIRETLTDLGLLTREG